MSYLLQLLAVILCLMGMGILFGKMRKKRISEEQALFWIMGVLGMLLLSCFPQILTFMADVLGIWWAPATLIFFLIIVIILIIFHHTEVITRMEAEVKELAMQVVLLKEEKGKLAESLDKLKGEE